MEQYRWRFCCGTATSLDTHGVCPDIFSIMSFFSSSLILSSTKLLERFNRSLLKCFSEVQSCKHAGPIHLLKFANNDLRMQTPPPTPPPPPPKKKKKKKKKKNKQQQQQQHECCLKYIKFVFEITIYTRIALKGPFFFNFFILRMKYIQDCMLTKQINCWYFMLAISTALWLQHNCRPTHGTVSKSHNNNYSNNTSVRH